jgi:hypothetical protein
LVEESAVAFAAPASPPEVVATPVAVVVSVPVADPPPAPAGVAPEAPRSAIVGVLNARAASFQQCVDAAVLRGDVGGQLSVGWVIVAGVVGAVHVVRDSTGNSLVGECFSKVISGLQFPPTLTAQVAAYPWSFATE